MGWLQEPTLLAIDRVRAEGKSGGCQRSGGKGDGPMPHGLGRGRSLHPDAMGRATRDDHDPAISRTDPLPVAGSFAAFDLVHVQHRRSGTPRPLVTKPESGTDPLPDRHWFGVRSAELPRQRNRLLWRQMGKPQLARGGAKRRVTEPLSFGVTTVGVQR